MTTSSFPAIYLIGSATTKFGELWDRDLRSLGLEAAQKALLDAKMQASHIDSLYVANMLSSRFSGQDHLGALFADQIQINAPSTHVEAACASGGVAIRQAWLELLSGQSQTIMVLGVEKMTDVSSAEASAGLSGASDEEWEAYYGVTFPSLYAMIAQNHMQLYGTTKAHLAACAVKNHFNACMNPNAHFRRIITMETAIKSQSIAEPLGLLDCSPISDGAAAIILSTKIKSPIELLTSQQSQDSLALHDRQDISSLAATKKAAQKAFQATNLTPQDIHFAEVHDCFTIAELLALEDLGFVSPGQSGPFVASGHTKLDGQLPINPSGGLKAVGHPVGATGIKQAAEIRDQLLHRAGERQVHIPSKKQFALTHNVGGSGATAVVSIWSHQT